MIDDLQNSKLVSAKSEEPEDRDDTDVDYFKRGLWACLGVSIGAALFIYWLIHLGA